MVSDGGYVQFNSVIEVRQNRKRVPWGMKRKGARQFEESIGVRHETEHSPSAFLNSVLL